MVEHLDKPFSLMESCNDVIIGSVTFRPWGNNTHRGRIKKNPIIVIGFFFIK